MPETRRERLVKKNRIFRLAHRGVAVQRTRRRMARRSAARSVKCSGFGPLVALGQLGAIVLLWIAALKGAGTITLLPIGTSSFVNPGHESPPSIRPSSFVYNIDMWNIDVCDG